ncbi:hypothetical protein K3181_12055 [Qipengyuania sp. YG27]|uniref:Uncharacterized protein n=1 Tax=Qipengyuania mesophila TaxID=2867246 RepID=A0ABS7JX48_9SPHN|nr:hypothetical protein [Qipengyuania mesophila]MBX7502176.1 hypothetical protein [Qipengyuania mesophila]
MSDQLAKIDPAAMALREALDAKWVDKTAVLTVNHPSGSVLAPTIIIARRAGGTGASMLALVLEFLLQHKALIIEVGGNRCPAFKHRSPENHRHFQSQDADRIAHAMDARLDHPGRIAILEFEPALYRDTLPVACRLAEMEPLCPPMLFYIACRNESSPLFAEKAAQRGLNELFMCRQAEQRCEPQSDEFLVLPWLDQAITGPLWREGITLPEAITRCRGVWTKEETRVNLEAFVEAILKRSTV